MECVYGVVSVCVKERLAEILPAEIFRYCFDQKTNIIQPECQHVFESAGKNPKITVSFTPWFEDYGISRNLIFFSHPHAKFYS